MRVCNVVVLVLCAQVIVASGCSAPAVTKPSMLERYQRVKASTFRVLVNGKPSGTGFAVGPSVVATNFHVVQQLSSTPDGQTQIAYASDIQVQYPDGRVSTATPHPTVLGQGMPVALSRDVALLSVPRTDLRPLRLGQFKNVSEGDPIYIAGYPLGVAQPIVATGVLSTKWKMEGYMNQGASRDVAWLDITMNGGNSGGPVLVLGKDPTEDLVVGIANFSLNPFARRAQELAAVAAAFPGNVMLMGVDFKRFSVLVGEALSSQSHGVGGCIAVDYVQVPQ